jgi:hypothetical protein
MSEKARKDQKRIGLGRNCKMGWRWRWECWF